MIIKFFKKKFNSIKFCAVFTTVCFVVSTLGANLYAIPVAEGSTQKYDDVFNKASSISNEYGKITASKDAKSDITVINIQDLHCHPQTQRNISKIISQIADKYNLTKIFVEGGYGDIDVSWLNQIKDENLRKQVIERLVEDGILTGSEYYKLTSNNNTVELKGIDEEQLHQDNIKRLSLIIENQNKYKELSNKINKEINFLEQRYVNIRNKRFNSSIEDYLSNKIDTKRFYRQLLKYVKDINANPENYNNITAIRLEDYPNIAKFMTLRKVSKNINVREVTQQLQIVINELKNKLPYNTYTRLLKETDNFSDSQKVVELISLLCDKEGIDLDYKYKSLSEFLKSNEINRELNTVALVYEERELITEIRKALSYNNEEYEITFVSDFSKYFQDYLEYKLTDADWKYFASGYEQFRQLYSKYATVDRIKEIESDIAELNKYYEINDIRNEIFVNNLLQNEQPKVVEQAKLRQDEEILKNSKEVIIAVTGGFHSQALEEILQAKEVNTIVITPSIFEGIEKATKQYKGIIKEQSKEFQHQALAYKILSCSKTPTQKAVMYGVLKSLLGNNTAKIKEVLGNVDLTELDNLLQNLQEVNDINVQKKVSSIKKILDIEAESLLNLLPKEGGKIVFFPNMDKLLLGISYELVNIGIFLSDGVIFNVENSTLKGKDLKGIPAEVYSRMHSDIQKGLSDLHKKDGSTNLHIGLVEKVSDWQFKNKIKAMARRQGSKQKIDDNYINDIKLLASKNYDLDLLLSLNRDLLGDLCYHVFYQRGAAEISEQQIRNLKELLDEYGLKYDTNVKDLRVDLLVEYCINSLNVTREQLNYLMKLAEELNERNIPYISTENDKLALKIFVNKHFNSIIDTKQKQYPFLNTLSAKYTIALDISRDLARRIGKIDNSDFVNLDELIERELEDYFFKLMDSSSQRQILGSQTKVIGLFADERYDDTQKKELGLEGENLARFNPKAMKRLLHLLGLNQDDTSKYQFISSYDEKDAKELYFEKIRKIVNGEKVYLLFSGHGYVDKIQVSAADKIFISAEEFANILIELNQKGVDLSNITIDLSSCFSYFFALKVYEILKNNGVTKFPNIWTTAGFETPIGITTKHGEYVDSNSLISLIKIAEAQQKQELTGLDLFKARIENVNANSTFFISGERVEEINNNVKQNEIIELSKNRKEKSEIITGEKFVKQRSLMEMMATQGAFNIKFEDLPSTPTPVSELSIFKSLSKYAHIWEEIVFRGLPALLTSFMIVYLSAMLVSFGISSVLFASLLAAIPGIFVFILSQKKFVEAHIIEDWIKTQNLSKKETFKLRVFGIFPSQELKDDFFKNFSKQRQNKIKSKSIKKETGTLVAPYFISVALSILLPITIPFTIATTTAATVTAQVYHYKYNESAELQNKFIYIKQLIMLPDMITEKGVDLNLTSMVNKREAISAFKSGIEHLKGQITDEKIKSQIEGITVEELEKNIEEINKYEIVFTKLEQLLDQINEFKGTKETKQELEKQFLDLVEQLCEKLVTLYNDETTGYHVLRAMKETMSRVEYSKLTLKEKYKLMIGSVMHDIGKNLVPDEILNKPGTFTPEEELVMHGHVWLGGCILKGSILQDFSEIAENHHYTESKIRQYSARSLTGSSFFSREGDKLSKIFSLVDIFEAVSYKITIDSERPYQYINYPEKIRDIVLLDVVEDLLQQIENGKIDLFLSSSERKNLIEKVREKQIEIKIAQEELEKVRDEKFALQRQRNKETDEEKKRELSNKLAEIEKEIDQKQKYLSKLKEDFTNYIFYDETDNKVIKYIRSKKTLINVLEDIKELYKDDVEDVRAFVDKMLYQKTNDELILFIRGKKREAVREKAFAVITTLDIQTVVAKMLFPYEDEIAMKEKFRDNPRFWQQQKERFIKEFKKNPQAWSDKIWESVNKFRVEFEKENIEAFLGFYFNDEDEAISEEMFKIFLDVQQFYKEKNMNMLDAYFIHPLLELIDKINIFMSKLNIFGSSKDFTEKSESQTFLPKLNIIGEETETKQDEQTKPLTQEKTDSLKMQILDLISDDKTTATIFDVKTNLVKQVHEYIMNNTISDLKVSLDELLDLIRKAENKNLDNELENKIKELFFLFAFVEGKYDLPDNLNNAIYNSIFEEKSDLSSNWEVFYNYMTDKNTKYSLDEKNMIFKMLSVLYAYKTWENVAGKRKSFDIDFEKGKHVLNYDRWVHICDGHSVFTNGIEKETLNKFYGAPNSKEYRENAINAIVTLDMFIDNDFISSILTEPDIKMIPKNPAAEYTVYVRRIGNKVHIYVLNSTNGQIITFYSKSYINANINMKDILIEVLNEKYTEYNVVAMTDNNGNIRNRDDESGVYDYHVLPIVVKTDGNIDLNFWTGQKAREILKDRSREDIDKEINTLQKAIYNIERLIKEGSDENLLSIIKSLMQNIDDSNVDIIKISDFDEAKRVKNVFFSSKEKQKKFDRLVNINIAVKKVLDDNTYDEYLKLLEQCTSTSVNYEYFNGRLKSLLEGPLSKMKEDELEELFNLRAAIVETKIPEKLELQTDFEKYFKNKKVLIQRFKTEEGVRRVKGFEILNFDKNSIKKIVGRFEVPVSERNYDSLGIIVEKDSDGNIVSVKAKEGYEFSSLLIDGEPVGDEKNNLNFSLGQISAMLKDVKILDYDASDIKEDEMDKYVAHIYLDDSKEELEKAMEEAIKNNKLMVIHVFRKGFSTKNLTLGQIRDKYEQAYSLLQSDKLKNLPILSEMIQLEKDVEVASYINCDFFLKELLKNHFGHGNLGLFEYPIACYISADGSKMVTYDSSLDLGVGEYRSPFLSEEFKNRGITRGILEELMNVTLIHGDGKGRKMMAESKTRNFEDSRNVNDSKISGYRFFKAMVTLKLETEEQIEAAKQYKKEQDAKARTSMSLGTSASTEDENLYSFGTSSSKTLSSVSKATEEDWADFWGDSILPENIVMVNKLLQFGKSALKVATWVALQEADFSLSMEQDENGEYVFVNAHGDNTKGAIELENFIEHWRNKTRWLNKVAPRIAKTIVKQASIVKHISIDYRFIKASGIREAIKLFGDRAKINEDGQIEVTIVDGIEQLQDSFTLINTGLKIEGSSIYRVKDSNLLIYGAKGQQSIKVAKTLDGSDILNKDIMEMIKSLGQQVDEIQTQGIIRKEGEGLSISEDILEIGELELQGKTTQQISQFIASGLEVKRAIGIMYGQKTIIDLKAVTDIEKLRATVYNGRARKVISKRQYDNLNLSKEDMEKLKEAGIEIYIDNGEEVLREKEIEGYKRNGVAGQVIRDEKGVRIRDYKVEGEIEIKEILEVKDIEREIITSEKPVMIGINILTEHFKQGNITNIQREFGALLGKIKMTFNIGELNRNDIESMGYNISFERIPQLSKEEIGRLFDNGEIADKERIIEVIGADTEFGIVLRTIKNKETEERFRQIIVERILAKEKLIERGNVLEGTELREKNMEKVLGQMLKRQIEQRYVEKEAKMEGITKTNAAEELMKAIKRLKELDKEGNKEDTAEQAELVNNIIEIILYDGERIKKEQMQQQADTGNMAKSYRSMLAAA